jgi:hypothetical protein
LIIKYPWGGFDAGFNSYKREKKTSTVLLGFAP